MSVFDATTFEAIAGSRFLAACGWTLLHLAWQLTAIAACVALPGRGIGGDPGRRHALALAGLGVGAVAACASIALLAWAPSARVVTTSAEPRVPALLEAPGVDVIARVLPWLGLAWLVFIAIGGARIVGAYVRTARLRGAMADGGDALAADYAEAGRRLEMRALPPLLVGSDGPALVGWLRPFIVVPRGLFESLARRDRVAILAHELAHVRRRDHVSKALQTAALVLLGWHPAARWLACVADREREKACDDLAASAMNDSAHVARALARVALARPAMPMPALSASASPIVERIERLARPRAEVPRPAALGATVAAVLAIGVGAAAHVSLRETIELLPIAEWNQRVVFDAQDPAGEFTVAVEDGRAVAVTMDGVAVPAERVRQVGQWVSVLENNARPPLHVRVVPPGAIEWSARSATAAPLPDPI